MTEKYALLDKQNGWLVNTVLWDGDSAMWQPPAGTTAVKLSEIDLAALPPAPQPESEKLTAEQFISQTLSPFQILGLQRLEMALLSAGKPLGPHMGAMKTWLESLLLDWSANPVAKPADQFAVCPSDYASASAEAVAGLQAGQNPET